MPLSEVRLSVSSTLICHSVVKRGFTLLTDSCLHNEAEFNEKWNTNPMCISCPKVEVLMFNVILDPQMSTPALYKDQKSSSLW